MPEPITETNHRVHMADGTIKTMTSAELEKLDPATWTSQEPADRERYIIASRVQDDVAVFDVIDRFGEHETQTSPSRQGAQGLIDVLNKETAK